MFSMHGCAGTGWFLGSQYARLTEQGPLRSCACVGNICQSALQGLVPNTPDKHTAFGLARKEVFS